MFWSILITFGEALSIFTGQGLPRFACLGHAGQVRLPRNADEAAGQRSGASCCRSATESENSMKRFLFTVAAAVFTLSLVAAMIAFKSSPSRAGFQRGAEITNQTISLQIISTKIDDEFITVQVKNVGTKPIVSYEIAYGHGGSGATTGFFQDAWQPGDTSEIKLSLREFNQSDVLRFNLTNCIFDDLSSEGDWEISKRRKEFIEGQRIAFAVGQKHFAKLIKQDQVTVSELRNISAELRQLTEPEDLSEFQKGGFRQGLELLQIAAQAGESNFDAADGQKQINLSQVEHMQKTFSRALKMGKTVESRIQLQKGVDR